MSCNVRVEICVDSVSSAIAAERGGAERVELCGALAEGGLTPSSGLMEMTRAAVIMGLHVIIRPRGGDFYYDDHEFSIMQRDIALAKRLGANGVTLGVLDVNGRVDLDRTRRLVELASPLEVTFHRAFDMTADLQRALEEVCAAGVHRILTSGGKQTAREGREIIAQLIRHAQGKIAIMPGSGIKPENVRDLVEYTGALEIHAGLRTLMQSPMLFRNPHISMGTIEGHEYERFVVLEENVRKLRTALAEASNHK